MKRCQAGFGKAIIPIHESDLPMREFQAIESELMIRSLYLKNEETSFILISFDLTSLTKRDIEKFKDIVERLTGIARTHIYLNVTHTFSAPHLKSVLKTQEDIHEYQVFFEKLTKTLTKAVNEAQKDLSNVTMAYQKVSCPLNMSRNVKLPEGYWIGRSLNGYSNHEMRIVSFIKENGHRFILFNYDMQSSVLDHIDNEKGERVISHDLYGYTAEYLEARDDIDVVMPTLGCAGDQRPLFTGKDTNDYQYAKAVLKAQATLLAEAILSAKQSEADTFDVTSECLKLSLPGQTRQKGTFDLQPTKTYTFLPGEEVKITLEALKLGKIVLVGTQPELNAAFGEKCRALIDDECVLITLCNGGAKYLPEQSDFDHITYQAMNTSIGKGADTVMLEGFKRLNERLKGEVL